MGKEGGGRRWGKKGRREGGKEGRKGRKGNSPSIMVKISHFCEVNVLNCGRFQNGDDEFLSIMDPHAPMLVTA